MKPDFVGSLTLLNGPWIPLRSLVAVLVLGLAGLGLSGCASKYGKQTTAVNLYPDCYEPIKKLRDEEKRVANTTIASAAGAGAATMAICLITKSDNCLPKALAVAATTGALGYFSAVQQRSQDETARMAQYMQDLDGDISNLNIATASARMSIQCYQKKFNTSLAQYKKKAISREELDASYREIKSGVNESQGILGRVIVNAQKSDELYAAAINEEEKLKTGRGQTGQRAPQSKSLDDVKVARTSYKASIEEARKTQKELDDFSARMAENMS
ncbi:MAG: hypothetical protein LBV70_03255 [Candidatus Adiutrix sp.]|jgi:hypothetical protein|nr:hypothetical protein [Candidatus Adiutrix sp.]